MKGFRNLIWFFLVFCGCSGNKQVPRNILQPEEMKQVMWDVFLAEAWANQIVSKDSTVILNDKLKELTQYAFDVNKTTEKIFFESYQWYLNHPEMFNSMLDSLQKVKSGQIHRPEISPIPLEEDMNGHFRSKKSLLITRDDLKAFD